MCSLRQAPISPGESVMSDSQGASSALPLTPWTIVDVAAVAEVTASDDRRFIKPGTRVYLASEVAQVLEAKDAEIAELKRRLNAQ